MFFWDIKKTYISIKDSNQIVAFYKIDSKSLYVETTFVRAILNYVYEKERNEDYDKLKALILQNNKEVTNEH